MRCFARLTGMIVLVIVLGLNATIVQAQFLEDQKLIASDAEANDNFGISIHMNGDTIVVGSRFDNCAAGFACGSAYVYRFDGTSWIEDQKLTASDASGVDLFGNNVAISGDTIIVGALLDNCTAGNDCGAAYIYRYNGVSWIEEQKLTASDAGADDFYGFHVSIKGDVAVVGAYLADNGLVINSGSAYVYRYNGTTWVEEQKLTASDKDFSDTFGWSVSVGVDTILVSAAFADGTSEANSGAAYIFRYNGTSWIQEQKLVASDPQAAARFGTDVSLEGDTAVIGANLDDCADGIECGSAYVFRFDGVSWNEEIKLTATDAVTDKWFGISVSLNRGNILVGAHRDDCTGGDICGSAYLFNFDGATWSEAQKLTASDAEAGDFFGASVSIYGGKAISGAQNDSCALGVECGSVYAFNGPSDNSVALSPLIADAPHDVTKDRYLSFNPSINLGRMTALRVTRVGSTTSRYVSCALGYAGTDGTDGKVGLLVQSPEFCEWTNAVIHIRGCDVVPGNEYLIEATADGVAFSAPVSIFTTAPQIAASRSYGDLVGAFENGEWKEAEGFVTANDIVAVVQKFQLLSTAPHISRVDNDGQTPNGLIASNDILREVQAFAGSDFGYGVTGCLTGTCVPNCP